jgi:hypothetical protein
VTVVGLTVSPLGVMLVRLRAVLLLAELWREARA